MDPECINGKSLPFRLSVFDNGKGIPKDMDLKNTGSLGLQLVTILADQIDGRIGLTREHGTE